MQHVNIGYGILHTSHYTYIALYTLHTHYTHYTHHKHTSTHTNKPTKKTQISTICITNTHAQTHMHKHTCTNTHAQTHMHKHNCYIRSVNIAFNNKFSYQLMSNGSSHLPYQTIVNIIIVNFGGYSTKNE